MCAATTESFNTYNITGKVIDSKSGTGLPGIHVEAWDKDLLFDDFLGKADTNATGNFQIELARKDAWKPFLDPRPDVYFKLYQGQELRWISKRAVLSNIAPGVTNVIIEVDTESTTTAEKIYRISGRVIDSETRAGLAALRVEAWDKDLLFDDWVAKADTDGDGYFQMAFTESAFTGIFFDRRPDLYFKIYQAQSLLWSTEKSILWNIDSGLSNIIIEVNPGAITTETEQATNIQGLLQLLARIDVMMWPIKLNTYGDGVHYLHLVLAGLGYAIPPHELSKWFFGVGTQWIIKQIQKTFNIDITGFFDAPTQKAVEEMLVNASTAYYAVEGRALFDNGLSANGVTLRLYLHGIGGPSKNAAGECTTDGQGFYFLTYYPQGKAVNIEIRAHDKEGKEIPLTSVKFNVVKYEVINLVVPSKGIRSPETQSEYQWLIHDLSVALGDWHKLAEVREIPEQRDITVLHQITGWDARLIALASIAVKFSLEIAKDSTIPANARLSPAFLYALFRTGLPSDKQLFGQLSVKTVEDALTIALNAGIVWQAEIEWDLKAFEIFIGLTRRNARSIVGLSSFAAFVGYRGDPDVPEAERLTADEKQAFEHLYFSLGWIGANLWVKVAELGISPVKIDGLRLQGKLAYLTQDNAILTHYLQASIGTLGNLATLVSKGLYLSASWELLIRNIANDKNINLALLIPPLYVGETIDNRLNAYATDLAEKVRFTFPTSIIMTYILKGNDPGGLNLGADHKTLQPLVCGFLEKAEPLGFKFGHMHVDAFIAQNKPVLFEGIATAFHSSIIEIIKKIHRLYQITPNDQAFLALYKLGFASAQEIASIPQPRFLELFSFEFNPLSIVSSTALALQIHNRAQQISAITFSMFTTMAHLASSPGIFALSGTPDRRKEDTDKFTDSLKDYPTTWSLFGSQDFCECRHCRSVLSPAAYFADLLNFLEPNDKEWDATMSNWLSTHDSTPYPFQSQLEWNDYLANWKLNHPELPEPINSTPYAILIERRPDLPYLALSCENTNTSLPYIDLVNEILEYHVAFGTLSRDAAHDTGTATTSELLAEPQNVVAEAYKTLNSPECFYPLSLPFDLWLETVRRFFDYFQTPLWQVLEVFRNTDQLFDRTQDYDRAAIFTEYLGFSPREYAIFTAPPEWFKLYGFNQGPNAGTVTFQENSRTIKLNSAMALSRRLGISYRELAELVSVGFLTGWKQEINLSLSFPDTGCDFEQTLLVTANGTAVVSEVYLRMNLFVRLWKKLGWSMEDVDQALRVFLPLECHPLSTTTLGAGFKTAFVYLAHLKTLDERVKLGNNNRQKLLSLWSNLFLTKNEIETSLAKALKLTVSDLIALKEISGLDPFMPLTHTTLNKLEEDNPFNHTPAFIEVLDCVKASGFSIEDIDYLIRHRFDPVGKYRENNDTLLGLVKTLATGLRRIRDEHTEPDDPLNFSDESIKREMALLVPTEVVDTFLAMWNGTIEYTAAVASTTKLDPKDFVEEKAIKLDYDDKGQVQRLVYRGVLLDEEKIRLKTKYDDITLFKDLLDKIQTSETSAQNFFSGYLKAILVKGRFKDYFSKISEKLPEEEKQMIMRAKRGLVASSLLPRIQQMLARQFVVETLAASLGSDGAITESLLAGDKVLVELKTGAFPLFDTFKTIDKSGVSVESYNGAGDLLEAKILPDGELQDTGIAKEVRLEGYFEVPVQGDYQFFVSCGKKGADLSFNLIHLSEPLIQGKTDKDGGEFDAFTKLKAGVPYQYSLSVSNPGGGAVAILVMGENLPKGALNRLTLYVEPVTLVNPLLKAFKATNESGLSVELRDGAGKLLEAKIIPDGEIKDYGTAMEVRLEGYFEVPAPGEYQFFVYCEKADADLNFSLSHLPEPLIQGITDDKIVEFAESTKLNAGVPYHFTLLASQPGGGSVRIQIKGANLPKGALNRLTLYPGSTVERVRRCFVLLKKTMQLVKTFQFNEREILYLWSHQVLNDLPAPSDPVWAIEAMVTSFQQADSNLKRIEAIEKVRTQNPELAKAADESSAREVRIFKKFQRLVDYARLKRDIADGTDDLIGIFEQANRPQPVFADLCNSVAQLTRRKPDIVREIAQQLCFSSGDFAQVNGLQRLWDALQLVERIGVPANKIAIWSKTVISFADDSQKQEEQKALAAADLKHSVKALYDKETWEHIAQAIFDPLRQIQRDALVAYILHHNGFERIEELFEYFLIDPGMEPAVQTSRIRLAISSVQTFIQRCLLNLEKYVSPLTINSKQWEWMKRYRVWEANRKIFLYPENWLEPEFRDDKTHLFQELESSLLQGDLSNDSAEDAFHSYLQGLEEIARLDIVTMCREQNETAEKDIIHVVGRTQNKPRKYYYRRYADSMWTPWEPLGIQIESDHVVASMWRGRLYVFWVTFTPKAKPPAPQPLKLDMDFPKMQQELKVQLNWSQYARGQWLNCQYNGFENTATAFVKEGTEFKESDVFVHIEKNKDLQYGETMKVHVYAENLLGEILGPFQADTLVTALGKADKAAKDAYDAASGSFDAFEQIKKDTKTAWDETAKPAFNVMAKSGDLAIDNDHKMIAPNFTKSASNALETIKSAATAAELGNKVLLAKTDAKKALDAVAGMEAIQMSSLEAVKAIANNSAKVDVKANTSASNATMAWNEVNRILTLLNTALTAVQEFRRNYSFLDGHIDEIELSEKAISATNKAIISANTGQDLAKQAETMAKTAVSEVEKALEAARTAVQQADDNFKLYPTPRLSFFLEGRHTPPQIKDNKTPPDLLYSGQANKLTRYEIGLSLILKDAFLKSTLSYEDHVLSKEWTAKTVPILTKKDGDGFYLLPCNTEKLIGDQINQQKRRYGPLFIMDKENTLFVEATWVEYQSLIGYEGYSGGLGGYSIDPPPDRQFIAISIGPQNPGDPITKDDFYPNVTNFLHFPSQPMNWVTYPYTVLAFDNSLLAEKGSIKMLNVNTGTTPSGLVVGTLALASSQSMQSKVMTVIDPSGLTPDKMQSIKNTMK